tara:strand:+ start:160 stop:786 length:627 start_codon:yes stop_codon:yes gene_type:complete
MTKLNNIKAVNEMIRGEHRIQTRTTKGFEEKSVERQIGDSWTDKNGQTWIQKNGYKAKVGKLSKIRKVVEHALCPECTKKATNFDKHFIAREGKCHDCIVKEETLLLCDGYLKEKKHGSFQAWEREKIRKNVNSFLKDAAKDVEMLKKRFTQTEYVNSDGTIDKWRLPESKDMITQSIDKQFEKFKGELLEKLEKGNKNDNVKSTTSE